MRNKRLLLLSGGALIAFLLVGTLGATVVFAQEPTPDPEAPAGRLGLGRGRGLFGFGRGGDWTMFDTAAEALGLTPEEFFAELHSGKSVKEIAEEQGVEMETLKDALETARVEAMRGAIEQAVEDGKMTQEQADWLLEGLDQGFIPRGRGFGPGRRWNNAPDPSDTEDL